VTVPAVLAALDEFDGLGRDAFLTKYGFGPAQSYFLVKDGKEYDSKAVVGAAHGHNHGRPLTAADFSGGDATVRTLLEGLGFVVRVRRNPPWTWDEVVLACDLVRDNGWAYLAEEDPRVIELAQLLQRLPAHPPQTRTPTFRNAAGVARKTADIATQHPDYIGTPTRGGQHDRPVLLEFLADPDRMAAVANAIREAGTTSTAAAGPPELDLDDQPASEGGLLERRHLVRERDPQLRRRKIATVLRAGLRVCCETCSFDFEQVYGPHGHQYIECHHRLPLHESGPVKTRLGDLALLCSNCHRMIHRRKPWLTVEQLATLITQHRPITD
jgi:5-methylcytosine-specific restriction protein A